MKHRIVFSNYDSLGNPFYGGGGARAIHEIARRLARRHAVAIVAGRCPGSRAETRDGVRYEWLGWSRSGPHLGQLLFQFLLPWRVTRGGFDLWVESLTPPFSTACLPWFTRRPVVALTQVLAGAAMQRKYRLPFAAMERFGLRAYRHAIVLSSHLDAVVRRANPGLQTVVIPNGVPAELIELAPVREEAHVLFLGRIDIEQKGLDLLIEALGSIKARLTLPVLIAGSGPPAQEEELKRRVRSAGLGDRVQLLGRVDDREKSELLRRSALLVMPSRFEASPLVLLEAFCHAVPVVTFDIPELADFSAACCVKVPPFDTRRLGAAILELLAAPERRAALGRAGKQLARQFSWDDLADRYEALFDQVLAGHG